MVEIIDCKGLASRVKENIKKQTDLFIGKPSLCVIQVGDNQASNAYINGKKKDCEEVGIGFNITKIPQNNNPVDGTREVVNAIRNFSWNCSGIMVQLPLPMGYNVEEIIKAIPKNKDVDGFRKDSSFIPCTPLGVVSLLKENCELSGKHAVVIGRSEIVGKPLAKLLLDNDCTVTVCHSKTQNIKEILNTADIICCAVGKRNVILPDAVKENTIIIDIGINRKENGKLCGDIDIDSFENSEKKFRGTTVPCGVGLLTRAFLLQNIVLAYKKIENLGED